MAKIVLRLLLVFLLIALVSSAEMRTEVELLRCGGLQGINDCMTAIATLAASTSSFIVDIRQWNSNMIL
jgi:succinate-acetate transporter protein